MTNDSRKPPSMPSAGPESAEGDAHTEFFKPNASGALSLLPELSVDTEQALAPSLRPGGPAVASAARTPTTVAERGPLPTLTPRRADGSDTSEAVGAVLRSLSRRRKPADKRPTDAAPAEQLERRLLAHLSRSLPPGDSLTGVLSRAAALEERGGQPSVARALRESALSSPTRNPVVLRDLRRDAILTGDHTLAQQLVARELESPLTPTAARSLRALQFELAPDAALELSPAPDAGIPEQLQRAFAQVQRGDLHAGSVGLWEIAKRSHDAPRFGLAVAAAKILQQAGDERAALAACELALESSDGHVGVCLFAARLARNIGAFDKAESSLKRALTKAPNRQLARALRRLIAQTALDRGDSPGDVRANLGAPEDASEARLLLRAEAELGNDAGAAAALTDWTALTQGRQATVPLCALAQHYGRHDDLEKAQDLFARAAALDEQATQDLGLSRGTDGRFVQAAVSRNAPESDLAMAAARATLAHADREEPLLLAHLSSHLEDATSEALGHDVEMTSGRGLSAAVAQWGMRLSGAEALGPLLALRVLGRSNEAGVALPAPSPQSSENPAMWATVLTDTGIGALSELLDLPSRVTHSPLLVLLSRLADPLVGEPGDASPERIGRLRAQVQAQPESAATQDLHVIALRKHDVDAIELVEGLLGARAKSELEQAAHMLAAGTAVAHVDADKARLYLQRTSSLAPHDAVLTLLQFRSQPPSSAAGTGAALVPGAALSLAMADEFQGRLAEAVARFEGCKEDPVLTQLAFEGLVRCALRQGDPDLALYLRSEALTRASSPESRASCMADVQDLLPLVSTAPDLQPSIEQVDFCPTHVAGLRALERAASALGRPDILREAAHSMSKTLSHRSDRTAYFKLWARMVDGTVDSDTFESAMLEQWPSLDLDNPSLALAAERIARSGGHRELLLRSLRGQIESAEFDNERASLALGLKRAMLESPRGAGRGRATFDMEAKLTEAIALLEPLVDAAPAHPTIAEELSLLHLLAGHRKEAAETLVKAATAANGRQRRASFLYHAARLYEFLGDADQAEELLTRVIEGDEHFQDAVERLESLLRAQRKLPALAALYAHKIRQENDPKKRLLLGLERHGFYLALGEVAVAEHLLGELLQGYEDPTGVLVSTAAGLRSQGRHRAAVSALIALAGRAKQPDLLRHAFFSLGEIYFDELSDLRRAEVAFSRCMRLDDKDCEALDRLCQIYAASNRTNKELRALRRLLEIVRTAADRERYEERLRRLTARS